ncbi:hypothetical protein [Candidatus Laterigemmans baculatus]|uniref:hypothetical protein n=1 Tax=Candidatus Laterigemmans baculatus TaxID=2770505 RepID=UPI0013DC5CD3|nr:hypothetical protein [Candidatus Laterigemmans baculatus]
MTIRVQSCRDRSQLTRPATPELSCRERDSQLPTRPKTHLAADRANAAAPSGPAPVPQTAATPLAAECLTCCNTQNYPLDLREISVLLTPSCFGYRN